MAIQNYSLANPRLGKFKGEILKHAVPLEVLSRTGRQIRFPKNMSDTYVARRFLPYGATSTSITTQNQFFQNNSGADRGNLVVQAHQVQEGVTPAPDSIQPVDVTVVIIEYACLYGYTDKTADLYEDDIPEEMSKIVGERVTLVNEMIAWGALRAGTNTYYGGGGTSIATTIGPITLGLVRKISVGLMANHAKPMNSVLKAGPFYGTDPVASGYTVYGHSNMEPDIRDLPNFVPVERYASGKPMPNEIGKCERFRFITSPDLPPLQDAGAAIGSSNLQSLSGTSIDVYPFIVAGEDAWSQLAVRGLEGLDPTVLPPGEKSKSDPHGQRGYVGTKWWKAFLLENQGWFAVGYVGIKNLS